MNLFPVCTVADVIENYKGAPCAHHLPRTSVSFNISVIFLSVPVFLDYLLVFPSLANHCVSKILLLLFDSGQDDEPS